MHVWFPCSGARISVLARTSYFEAASVLSYSARGKSYKAHVWCMRHPWDRTAESMRCTSVRITTVHVSGRWGALLERAACYRLLIESTQWWKVKKKKKKRQGGGFSNGWVIGPEGVCGWELALKTAAEVVFQLSYLSKYKTNGTDPLQKTGLLSQFCPAQFLWTIGEAPWWSIFGC